MVLLARVMYALMVMGSMSSWYFGLYEPIPCASLLSSLAPSDFVVDCSRQLFPSFLVPIFVCCPGNNLGFAIMLQVSIFECSFVEVAFSSLVVVGAWRMREMQVLAGEVDAAQIGRAHV